MAFMLGMTITKQKMTSELGSSRTTSCLYNHPKSSVRSVTTMSFHEDWMNAHGLIDSSTPALRAALPSMAAQTSRPVDQGHAAHSPTLSVSGDP